jgi:hypothetical protein
MNIADMPPPVGPMDAQMANMADSGGTVWENFPDRPSS